jgi:DNA-binding LacI/PurR family transcriptional regulator
MPNTPKENNSNRPSIRTVAQEVKLSPTTVSLGLRNDPSIPLETRERILAAAAKLNYSYAPRASKRRAQALKQIVFLQHAFGDVPVVANPFYGRVLTGAESTCRTHAANLSFVVLRIDHSPADPLPDTLKTEPDGLLVVGAYPKGIVERLSDEVGLPMVLIDNVFPDICCDSVMTDDVGGAYQAVDHLIGMGHKRIAVVTGRHPEDHLLPPSYQERYRGYLGACQAAGLAPMPLATVPDDINVMIESGRAVLHTWLKPLLLDIPEPPTAIFCTADHYANAILIALNNLGMRVPADMSVASFDDISIASMLIPSLTTVHVYKEALGRIGAERLLARINGDDTPHQRITVGTELVVRNSAAPLLQAAAQPSSAAGVVSPGAG